MSRELDREVAEKVMGWEVRHEDEDWGEEYYPIEQDKNDNRFITLVNTFKPSSDISAAFQVVEKMRERGFNVEVYISDDPGAFCAVYNRTENEWGFLGDGDCLAESEESSVPEAICRAALAAMKAEQP